MTTAYDHNPAPASAATAATCLLALLPLAGGCASDQGDPRPTYDGSASGAPSSDRRVPRDAELVVWDRGHSTFRAPYAGRVYIVDSRNDTTVFEGPIALGEEVRLDPAQNRIYIEDHLVKETDLKEKTTYRTYFKGER